MTDKGAEPSGPGLPSLPATMADIFLALVGVVIIILLSLAPAIRTPSALAAPQPVDRLLSSVTINGEAPLALLADGSGLAIEGHTGRRISLDGIRDDAELAAALQSAKAAGKPILLAIAADGQEAAFVFEGLASSLNVPDLYQLRLDGSCGYVTDRIKVACQPERAPA